MRSRSGAKDSKSQQGIACYIVLYIFGSINNQAKMLVMIIFRCSANSCRVWLLIRKKLKTVVAVVKT